MLRCWPTGFEDRDSERAPTFLRNETTKNTRKAFRDWKEDNVAKHQLCLHQAASLLDTKVLLASAIGQQTDKIYAECRESL
ncbi:unnamed protein product [Parascedosporium putredinis]|uniref:Uncharacterized protein n=1 Tax=Parascedosporium putredinis TaxID=1442378 RepID=A0A9P1H5J6_9PEZI|nr:unnamed protein product [Parascedosporium putredinis]CAI7996986.1 unnamed protein product [Parascedosporium putredinis]